MVTLRPRRNLALDIGPALAVALIAIAAGGFDRAADESLWLSFLVGPLLLRRLWPLPVLVVVVAGVEIAVTHGSGSAWGDVAAVGVASFSLGESATSRTSSVTAVLVVASAMAVGFVAQGLEPFQAIVYPFVVLVPSWLVGDLVRLRQAEALAREEALHRAARDREAAIEAAALEARRNVARELHDIVAHAVSVMLVQAGAARQVLRTSPTDAERSLLAVEATGREAMGELRRLVGVLGDEGDADALSPQPGVAQIPALVDRVRGAGLPAVLEVHGPRRELPAGLDVTAYRIAQEALTNALRYAGRATTFVELTYDADQLRLEVLDDGPPASGGEDGSGRGLVGMRERAASVGGRLEAGPRIGGGYAVRAWLPLESVTR